MDYSKWILFLNSESREAKAGYFFNIGSVLRICFAASRVSSISFKSVKEAIAKSGRPDWRTPAKSPGPRSSKSRSAKSKPFCADSIALSRSFVSPEFESVKRKQYDW